jgi:hypothetical protein
MSRQQPKRPRDPAQLAKMIVDIATGEIDDQKETAAGDGKSSAARELGRLGGIKGGKARAERLSDERRAAIARKAAMRRWHPEKN